MGAGRTWLSEEELARLAGPMPETEEFLETCLIRWRYWKGLRLSTKSSMKWVKKQIGELLKNHPTSWKVIGFTRRALESLAGEDRMFNQPRGTGLYQRCHLFPRRAVAARLLDCDHETPMVDWARWIWERDITVVGMTGENKLLEDAGYFRHEAVTFSNPAAILFSDDCGGSWTYGGEERQFLRGLSLG